MNKKLIHFIAVSFAMLSFTTFRTHADPDHLTPCPVYCTTYDAAVFSALLNNTKPRLWMIEWPDHAGQSAVIIDEVIEYEEIDDSYAVKSRQLFLKYIAFKKKYSTHSIPWGYDPNEHYSVDMSNDLERCEIPVDIDFATTMENAWTSLLATTKYSDGRIGGSSHIFYCDNRFGCTDYSMGGGLPMKLAELGEKLSLLAQSEEKDRDALKQQCLELAIAIQKETNPNQILDPTWTTPVLKAESVSQAGQD
jgi:hypothetical protein